MSGVIFALIAAGWAVYLLPKALKRHEDLDRSRPVEEFSGAVRVVGRGVAPAAKPVSAPAATAPPVPVAPVPSTTRESARRAARRRRRVLALLLTTLVAVTASSALGYTPWFTTAIPAAVVVVFLVVARLSVRAQQVRRVAPVQQEAAPTADVVEVEPDLGIEDTVGVSRAELDAELAQDVAEPVLDEGGLWDPLPVTLPTYVNKARARRTVRTIEITGEGSAAMTSSGHDAADSALAAEARRAEQQEALVADEDVVEAPKAAGA